MINFNISPERKFPLVPIPTEPVLISLECSPFDNSEAASYSSEDPFELVLRSVTKTKPAIQSVEVQNEKSVGMWKPVDYSKLSDEAETSYTARVVATGQSQSLVQALAIEGLSNFSCNENVTCIMDISDPTGFDTSSEFTKSPVTADKSVERSNGFLKLNANADDEKESAVLERDITTLVNEKLNSCIQMVLNRSCSKLQQEGSASVRELRRSLADTWHTSDFKGAEFQNKQASCVRKSLHLSLDNTTAKASYLLRGGMEMSGCATSSSDASTTGSVFNRGFLCNASSDARSMTSQVSGTSHSSAGTSVFPLGCSNAAVTSVNVRRWLNTADGRMRALSCDKDFTCMSPSADCPLPSPAHSAHVLNNSSLSSVFSPPLVTKPGTYT
ncbi:hypothetical protein PR048_033195 [Dryococelus australis]|uniref:Uncharacterized protein n=1 Tax=Dryococelus australis TaxID=614101 RepID=A0ABQ9FZK9_9NEOP|nr:hypothetical protein PR048_033195 [Dryococelus australis]